MFLFLASSGARIGETLRLEIQDFDLKADAPRAFIRADITKGGVGERTVYFSYEARDALKNWLAIKDNTRKSEGTSFKSPLMFPITIQTAITMFYSATRKAELDQRDRITNRHLLHIHSLRKFFRSNIGLDTDMVHALMGHSGYLDDAYLRLDSEEVAEAYKKNMHNVSVYAVEDVELRRVAEKQKEEICELRSRVNRFETHSLRLEALLNERLAEEKEGDNRLRDQYETLETLKDRRYEDQPIYSAVNKRITELEKELREIKKGTN